MPSSFGTFRIFSNAAKKLFTPRVRTKKLAHVPATNTLQVLDDMTPIYSSRSDRTVVYRIRYAVRDRPQQSGVLQEWCKTAAAHEQVSTSLGTTGGASPVDGDCNATKRRQSELAVGDRSSQDR